VCLYFIRHVDYIETILEKIILIEHTYKQMHFSLGRIATDFGSYIIIFVFQDHD